jgi:hypothetical protein
MARVAEWGERGERDEREARDGGRERDGRVVDSSLFIN